MKLLALLLVSSATASPLSPRDATTTVLPQPESTETSTPVYDWSAGWKPAYTIHQSCNNTLRTQLEDALDETVQLATHARDHILRFGRSSEFFQKYFGANASTAGPIGWYDRVAAADKTGVIFRCDDPDRNCETQDGWAGHWRGSNATLETVICPLSFQIRRPLSAVCGLGYTVAASKLNTYWATDLLHRVLHVPAVSEGVVEHYAEDYADALRLGKEEPELAWVDSDVLQYFAIDVWAYDIAAPGVGCTGEAEAKEESTPTTTSAVTESTTTSASAECHTHDDGVVHCS